MKAGGKRAKPLRAPRQGTLGACPLDSVGTGSSLVSTTSRAIWSCGISPCLCSGENVFDKGAVNVSQSKVTTAVTVSELFMIKAH